MIQANLQPNQINDIAAAELRQIFIDAIVFGFRPDVLAEKVQIPVGASGIDRQAYAMEILEHAIESKSPSISTARANRMDLHFAAALSIHWAFLEEFFEDPYRTTEDLEEIATFIADVTVKSCAPDCEFERPVRDAEIIQLPVKLSLKNQFEKVANILDDFDLEDYRLSKTDEREKKLSDLSEDMAQEIHVNEVPIKELQDVILTGLTSGFNDLFFFGYDMPAPEHVEDKIQITKEKVIAQLIETADRYGLRL